MYEAQKQSVERSKWAESVRQLTSGRDHRVWEPSLDPPALLSNVCCVLVAPRRPLTVGTVARSCSAFECQDLRIVQPRQEYLTRQGRSASKGAQYIMYRHTSHESVAAATADCSVRVAFTRWVEGRDNAFLDINAFVMHPGIQQVMQAPLMHPPAQEASPPKLALVFGREELGLSDEEVDGCDLSCSIPMGRLQESLSVSHAVSIALCALFQQRLASVGGLQAVAQRHLTMGTSSGGE